MAEQEEEMMVKTGRVEVGVTPSVQSGKVSSMIKSGEALSDGEENADVDFKSLPDTGVGR